MTSLAISQESPFKEFHPETTGYEWAGCALLPWLYQDFDEEYRSFRSNVALFDHSAIGLFSLSGDGAAEFLQLVAARDVEYLGTDQCIPSLVLDGAGAMVDIVVIYALEDRYLLETSVGHAERLRQHLDILRPDDVELNDLRGTWSMLGIEGPYSWQTVGSLFDPELTALPFQTVLDSEWNGEPIRIARAGFTAEYGYKILGPIETLKSIWAQAVKEEQVAPAGQAVLEVAMTEVRQPMPYRDALLEPNVIELGLNWLIDRSKESFVGRDAVEAMWASGPGSLRFGARCVAAVEAGAEVLAGDQVIGVVTSLSPSPQLGEHIALLQIDPAFAAAGLDLEIRSSAAAGPIAARTISSPYVVPASWSVPIF